METITLYTRHGGEVTQITVPPFQPPTEIIQWGARFFVRNADGQYREAMLWPSFTEEGIPAVQQPIALLLYGLHLEIMHAMELHKPYNSFHEAYAVMLEELEEYWSEVKKWPKTYDVKVMRKELMHVAATAIRTIVDLKL